MVLSALGFLALRAGSELDLPVFGVEGYFAEVDSSLGHVLALVLSVLDGCFGLEGLGGGGRFLRGRGCGHLLGV